MTPSQQLPTYGNARLDLAPRPIAREDKSHGCAGPFRAVEGMDTMDYVSAFRRRLVIANPNVRVSQRPWPHNSMPAPDPDDKAPPSAVHDCPLCQQSNYRRQLPRVS